MACAVGKASVALEESAVCSSSDSSSPTCEVSFSGITPGVPVRLTIEVAQSDFNSDSEYISLVTAGTYSMGTDFLRYTGQQDNCSHLEKILHSATVPSEASSGGLLRVQIQTTSEVNCCGCSDRGGVSTLYAIVTIESHTSGCVGCRAGTYSNTLAARGCLPCEEGKYVNTSGASACLECAGNGTSTTCETGEPSEAATPGWGSSAYSNLNYTMAQLRRSQSAGEPIIFVTGGLGSLLVEDVYEVWICLADLICARQGDHVRIVNNHDSS